MIEECDSEEYLNEREIYWIAFYNSTDYSIGYNLMLGGYKTRGAKHSERTKQKISQLKKGCHPNRDYTVSEDTKKKISNTLKEYYKSHKNPRYGVTLSAETKEKLRQANLGKKQSEETIAKRLATIQERKRLGVYSYKRTGRIWISNGTVRKQILPEELDTYLIQGYRRGWKLSS